MYDVWIRNALIYDGNGGSPIQGDVAVIGDRIAAVGTVPPQPAAKVIDAQGMCLLPGFIDSHTHSDGMILTHHSREEALRQGITTEVVASCGIGIVPMTHGREDYLRTIVSIVGDPGDMTGIDSVEAYFAATGNAATNYAMQIAHSPIRIAAVGNRDVPIGKAEMAAMERVTHQAFEEGACAFSTGLAYFPAAFSDTEEVVRLCHVAKEHNAPFTIHLRSVINKHFPNGIDPIGEAIEIAKKSGVHLHFSHFKTRKQTAGQVADLVRPIEEGLAAGLRITADFYPYPVGCGHISVFLPPWVMDGSVADALARIADPVTRERMMLEMERDPVKLADGIFSHAPRHPEYLGRSFAEVAQANGERVSQMLVRFLYEEELEGGYIPHMDLPADTLARLREDYAALIRKPYYMVGSDTLPCQQRLHPRTFDTFPKVLRAAQAHGVPLEILAHRMAKNPAQVFGLENRGVVVAGYHADLLLFRKDTMGILDRPEMVFVNGVCTLNGNVLSPELAGQGIRHKG